MKTNQLMTVALPNGTLDIYHKTAVGSLTDLFSLGNGQRIIDGKKPMNQSLFIKSKATQEFIQIIAKELESPVRIKLYFQKVKVRYQEPMGSYIELSH